MATMNGIDVSNYQNGINLAAVPAEFVICKATQGIDYVSPDCARQYEQAKAAGRKLGIYHYIDGSGAEAEAKFFYENCKNWVKEAVFCLDWESKQNSKWGDMAYLQAVIVALKNLTDIPPIVYVQQSAMGPVGEVAARQNCGLWIAQYANMDATGYQDSPWNEGAYACVIRQYSSTGRLSGYNGDLDLNKAYIDAATWDKYANPGGTAAPAPEVPQPSAPSGSTLDLAVGVMQGKYGAGDARKAALGSRYQEVQDFINHIAGASTDTLVSEVMAGKYGNGDTRKTVLGNRYDEVQARINGSAGRTYTVVSGDTLSGIGTKLGVDWQSIAAKNGIGSPYTIYPGQKLSY